MFHILGKCLFAIKNLLFGFLVGWDRLETQLIRKERNFTYFMDHLQEYERLWKININSINRYYNRIISGFPDREILARDLFIKGFYGIKRNWSSRDDFVKYKVTIDILLNPLKDFCIANIEDPRSEELLNYIINAKDAHFDISNLREVFKSQFEKEKETLINKQTKLIEAHSFFIHKSI